MKTMKKKVTFAVTVALLAFPLSSALAQARVPNTPVVVADSTTTVPATTITELQVTEATEATEAAVAAVAAYEIGPITTLAEIATAEDLKAAAVTAVAAVGNTEAKTAFELRLTNRAEAITTIKAVLNTPVVDVDGNEITSATVFSDFIDSLQLALAFDPARKCELNERHALRKLAQAHKLMKDGNIEASQICLNEYTDKIAMAQTFLIEVEKTDSETAKTLDKALVNLDSNNIQVLSNLIDKLPPQAAEKLALNVVRSMEKAVTQIQKEEAKVVPVTTLETTPATDSKMLEKQAQVALESFKNSLAQKGKIHIEDLLLDQDQHDNGDMKVVEEYKPEHETSKIELNSPQVTQKVTQNKIENNTEYQTENKASQAQSIIQTRQTHVTALSVKTQKELNVVCPTDNDREEWNKQEAPGNDKRGGSQNNRSDHK